MDVSLHTGADMGSSGDAIDADGPSPPDVTAPPDAAALQEGLAGMDVSAQTLRDIKFREKFRGYHPDDVDEFLEQVAEGITYLQGRLREAQQSALDGATPGAPIENNEALRRTLVLAQRTAELAVQEARHEAERIESEARRNAEAIVTRAEDAARRTVDDTNARLRDEVGKLEAARERLRADVDDLERYLEDQRQHLHASLSNALTRVEEVLPPATRPAPEPAPAEVPPVPWPEPVERSALWEPPSHPYAPVTEAPPAPQPAPLEPMVAESPAVAPPLAVDEPGDPEPAEPLTVTDDHLDSDLESDEEVGSIWADVTSPADDDAGWATSMPPAALDDEDDDPFIAELRRAITDTSPLGPRDDFSLPSPEGLEQPQEKEVPAGRRFRRKRH